MLNKSKLPRNPGPPPAYPTPFVPWIALLRVYNRAGDRSRRFPGPILASPKTEETSRWKKPSRVDGSSTLPSSRSPTACGRREPEPEERFQGGPMTEALGLRSAVLAFLEGLAVRYGRRPRTIQTYRTALQRFLEYLSALNVDPDQHTTADLDPGIVRDFITYLEGRYREEGRALPTATRQTYLAALVGWVNFLLDEGLWRLPAEEARRLVRELRSQRGRPSPPLPRLPREEVLEALLRAARSRPAARSRRKELLRLRDLALLLVLRSSGIRVGELVALRRGDFDPAQGILWVRHGKGGKERLAFLDRAAVQALQAYLQARDAGARGKAVDHRPLFARHDRGAGDAVRPLTPEGVRRALMALAREAGLEEALTPHQFRHYFATRILEATGDLAAVQDLLGHASPTTTRRYARVSPKRLRAVHRQAFEGSEPDP